MKKQVKFFTIFSVMLILTIFGVGISYAAPSQDRVVAAGEVVEDALNITDNLNLEAGGLVSDDVTILGGNARIAGTISGDLVVVGGNVTLVESAVIDGDCIIIGGTIEANDSTTICTAIAKKLNIPIPPRTPIPPLPLLDAAGLSGNNYRLTVSSAIFSSILLAILAFGITMIAPRHIERIGDAVTAKPVASGTVGILTFIAAVSALTILSALSALLAIVCIGLLGIPIVLALSGLLVGAMLVGWVAIGKITGDILCDILKLRQLSIPMTAALGTAVFSLANTLISTLPAIGVAANIVIFFIGAIGLGAVALTRFGTRTWPRLIITDSNIGFEDEIIIRPMADDDNSKLL